MIYHGYTLTSKVKFWDVIQAIEKYAFVVSPYTKKYKEDFYLFIYLFLLLKDTRLFCQLKIIAVLSSRASWPSKCVKYLKVN